MCDSCRLAWAVRTEQVSRRLSTRIGVLRPSTGRWVALILLAALPWVLDFSCLAVSVVAVGSPVPWGGLLVPATSADFPWAAVALYAIGAVVFPS
jgi:uncharacterized membrane protein YbhN (UPF0104 family)